MEDGGDIYVGGAGGGGDLCLICGKVGSGSFRMKEQTKEFQSEGMRKGSSLLSKHLRVYFILKHILELPLEQLERYLRECPESPENWLETCDSCSTNYVDKCFQIFADMLEIQRRFRTARFEVVGVIKGSFESQSVTGSPEEVGTLEFQDEPKCLDINAEARRFVKQNVYERPSDTSPFLAGDSLAFEKIAVFVPNVKAEGINITIAPHPPTQIDEVDVHQRLDELDISPKVEPASPAISEKGHADSNDDDNWSTGNLSEPPSIESSSSDDSEEWNASKKSTSQKRSQPTGHKGKNRKPNTLNDSTCPKCGKTFSSNPCLQFHLDSVHNENRKKLKCEHCVKEFYVKRNYYNHLGLAHGITDHLRYKCTFGTCSRAFYTISQLEAHQVIHKPAKFECKICGIAIRNKPNLQRHMKNQHTKDGKKPFQCDLCPASFARNDNLLSHQRKMHPETPDLQSKEKSNLPTGRSTRTWVDRKYIKCSECELSFGKKEYLEQHIIKMHGGVGEGVKTKTPKKLRPRKTPKKSYQCTECSFVFPTKSSLQSHKRSTHAKTKKPKKDSKVKRRRGSGNLNKIFKCDHCNKEFKYKPSLLTHMSTVHKLNFDFKHKCTFPGCEKSFALKDQLNYHEEIHQAPQHRCDICEKVFLHQVNLKYHKRRLHNFQEGEDPSKIPEVKKSVGSFTCKQCDMIFTGRKVLQTHLEHVHGVEPDEGPSPYQCSICKLIYSSSQVLQNHVESVHERKQEVCCDLCGRILRNRSYLKKHKARVHKVGSEMMSRFPCSVEGCSRSFDSRSKMKQHIQISHERQRPFQCEICGQRMATQEHVNRHIQAMHTNRESKPFKCDECGKGFAVKGYVWLHKKTHQKKPVSD